MPTPPEVRVLPLHRPPVGLAQARELLGDRQAISLDHQWPKESTLPPALVRMGHFEGRLHLLSEIPDACVVSRSSAPNERMWQLGDTFEIFLKVAGELDPTYIELHVTPHNHRLQLHFPSERYFQENRSRDLFEEFLLPDPSFESETLVHPEGWFAWAAVAGELLGGEPKSLAGQSWQFSFCRYDYDDLTKPPRLSSTSPHHEPDFHRLADWGLLRFV